MWVNSYLDLNVESGRVDTTLVQSSQKVQNDLLSSLVVNDLKLTHILYLVYTAMKYSSFA